MKFDTAYIIETMKRFIETPSPVGYYEKMKPVIEEYASSLGYSVTYDNRDTAYIRVEGGTPPRRFVSAPMRTPSDLWCEALTVTVPFVSAPSEV